VGREAELTQLHTWLDKALQGERQLVFVTGEPGIGKTALVETFLQHLSLKQTLRSSARGQEGDHLPPQRSAAGAPDGRSLDPHSESRVLSIGIAHGYCIEHFGTGEAYLPVFTALDRLSRTSGGGRLAATLMQYAPTWLAQMPALLDAATLETVRQRTQGTTPERMLREITEALEALTAEQPLVLVLEDLHWSGDSTLDLLSFMARHRHPARLFVLGTY
jgi:hypothetical protein